MLIDRVTEQAVSETELKIHLPPSAPDQAIFAMLLGRLPRLVT